MTTRSVKFFFPIAVICCLLVFPCGCSKKRVGHPADLAEYYASHYPDQPQKKTAIVQAPKKTTAVKKVAETQEETPAPSPEAEEEPSGSFCAWVCSWLWFCGDDELEANQVKKAPDPQPVAVVKTPEPAKPPTPKVIPHWQKSKKHRRKEKFFIGYTPTGVKSNRYFHNIKRIGLFLRPDMTLAYEYGSDTDVNIPFSVKNQDLDVIREGVVFRKYMDNSFYLHLDLHKIYLRGYLYYDDPDAGGENQASISSETKTLSFGVGNEWYVTRHLTLGLDWFTIPTIIHRSYRFNPPATGNTSKTRSLNRRFRISDPVSQQARLPGGFVINMGYTF